MILYPRVFIGCEHRDWRAVMLDQGRECFQAKATAELFLDVPYGSDLLLAWPDEVTDSSTVWLEMNWSILCDQGRSRNDKICLTVNSGLTLRSSNLIKCTLSGCSSNIVLALLISSLRSLHSLSGLAQVGPVHQAETRSLLLLVNTALGSRTRRITFNQGPFYRTQQLEGHWGRLDLLVIFSTL